MLAIMLRTRKTIMKRTLLVWLAVLALAISALAQLPTFDGQSWWNYVKVLAADDMEGRDTGSAGLRKASTYVMEEVKKSGLEPAGTSGYYQPVNFISRQIDEKDSSLVLVRDGKADKLVLGEDAMFSTRYDLAPKVDAPLVFAGYGLRVPETNYDDFSGLDVKGKVIVYIAGSPADVPAALSAHYQSSGERVRLLRELGAVGMVAIPNPASMDIPWSRMTLSRTRPSMVLADPTLDDTQGIQLGMTFNPADAEKLFAGSGHTFAELVPLAKERKPMPHFPLSVTIQAKAKVIRKNVESDNIVAKLPGSDPSLKDQYVVLSAHIDHIGIGEPINGDKIYNGAMDNASGSALLLDIAAALHTSNIKPKRSILFLWVTGEEKGLLGSKYYAAHPTVPKSSIIADLNTDMFLPIVPLKVLTVLGLNESTLGDDAREVAKQLGVEVQPDPEPLRNSFVRSDQYSFIRQGVPSLAMGVGTVKGSPEAAIQKEWLTKNYHAPSDDLNQHVDLPAAGKYEDVMLALALKVADAPQPPQWNSDSFFRRFAVQAQAGK
jgi:Zn-dependent M28 family amino/carboxypeptidase